MRAPPGVRGWGASIRRAADESFGAAEAARAPTPVAFLPHANTFTPDLTGEPPATRGYPPSVFAMMPQLLEKAGTGTTGSITGLYTVLVEGDDHNEPIADTARSILDGHIVLTRKLATVGHFPAIDVLESISRVAGAVVPPHQMADAREVRRLMGALRDVKELIEIGAYQSGTDPLVDRARELAPAIEAFLQQPLGESTPAVEAWEWLQRIARAT